MHLSEAVQGGVREFLGTGAPSHTFRWILQIVEAKEAGAAGILGVISSVSGAGAPVLSSFTAALGLDAPVEVACCQVQRKEMMISRRIIRIITRLICM